MIDQVCASHTRAAGFDRVFHHFGECLGEIGFAGELLFRRGGRQLAQQLTGSVLQPERLDETQQLVRLQRNRLLPRPPPAPSG